MRFSNGDVELVGEISISDHFRQTRIRFKEIYWLWALYQKFDQDYESENAIPNGFIFEVNTPQFNLVHRSKFGNGCDFKHQTCEVSGNNCFIANNSYCLIKCI